MIGDQLSFPLDMFSVPHHYKGDVKEIMIPHGLVIDRYVPYRVPYDAPLQAMREHPTRFYHELVVPS